MLNFRTASLIAAVLATGALIAAAFRPEAVWLLVAVAVAYASALAWGAASIRSGFYVRSLNRAATGEREIALTFDDGPDPDTTPRILEILEKNQVKATFFIIGHKAFNNKDLLNNIAESGHALGIHSWSHSPFFDFFGKRKMVRDLEMTSQLIRECTGQAVRLFRPPFGVTNPTVAYAASQLGLTVAGWSVRSLDTQAADPARLAARIRRRLHPGAVVLLHDDREVTVKALQQIIDDAKAGGYRFFIMKEPAGTDRKANHNKSSVK